MTTIADQVDGALRAVWRRRWVAVFTAWGLAALGIVAVWFIPNRYEASARVFVDTQTVLKPLMAGLAFQPDTDLQVKMLARTLVSRPNVERLIKTRLVGFSQLQRNPARSIDMMLQRIQLDSSGGNLYIISYRDPDPALAKAVVSGLVDMFVNTGIRSKQRDSSEAGSFIDAQIKEYEGKLRQAEQRLKDFKVRNFAVSGLSSQDYFARTSNIVDEVTRLKIAYSAAVQSRDALQRELANTASHTAGDADPALALPPTDLDRRVTAAQNQLDDLRRRYTDAHPDVVSARENLRLLLAQQAAERAAQRGRAVTANPAYERIRVTLAEAEANVASLGSQLAAQQQRLDQLRATATKVPQEEEELAQLNRDYDIIRHNYDLLVSRREAASLGVKMDESDRVADFRVIEPPRVAPKPVFPDRTVLAVLAMLFAIGGGVATAWALNRVSPTFDAVRPLEELTRRPVIGTVGRHPSRELIAAEQMDRKRLRNSAGAFLLVQAVWIILVAVRIGHFP